MGTGWMGNHQIPALGQHLLNWCLIVPAWVGFAFQQVTAPRVVAVAAKRIAHSAAVFTCDEDAHSDADGESLECVHGGSAGSLGSVALSIGGFALQALVVDAGGVLALSVEVAELLDLSGGHRSVAVDV